MNKKYWHISSVDSCTLVYMTQEEVNNEDYSQYDGNFYGPFDTITECKKDAREYHLATISYARMAINDMLSIKASDLKKEEG